MKKTDLRKYARLIVLTGANVKKGQDVEIHAELDQPEFVTYVVEECYRAGARKVVVEWSHQPISKINMKKRSLKTLSTIEDWEVEKYKSRVNRLPAMIHLISEDPDGMNGINQKKQAMAMQARYKVFKPMIDEMEDRYQWVIAAIPGKKWAKKMFPHERTSRAMELLWEAIFAACRIDDDPVAAWDAHNADLSSRCEYLNSLGIETLEYRSANGTDLRVGLMERSRFLGGAERTKDEKRIFNPNIPTEEVFVTPKRGCAEGIVYATKPLSYGGELIENFSVRFEDGRAVEVKAEKNEDLLRQLISMDEGAAYLGECALVPFDSPIQKSGLLFYNTLFDENAACHLALGRGFNNSVADYENCSRDELKELGVNDSMVHEDFMIGSEDLTIIAHTRDGKQVRIFENGNWAF